MTAMHCRLRLLFVLLLRLPLSQQTVTKVFILAGQSNQVGHGSLDHLDELVSQEDNNNEYRKILWNQTRYKSFHNVYIRFEDHHGPLRVGRDTGYAAPNQFGPELLIGQVLGEALTTTNTTTTTTVLLVKMAWGGKTLTIDFRPPSAGEGHYSNVHPIEYGAYYRLMLAQIQETLQNLTKYVPNGRDYELTGLVWFQGWNDLLDVVKVQEYAQVLVHFIRDVRLDLGVPELPVVIGESGMFGTDCKKDPLCDNYNALRAAQQSVTQLDEFRSNTLFVPTAEYAVLNGTTYNGIYHYNGRADTYFHIGQAMGKGLLHLLKRWTPGRLSAKLLVPS